jgi:hypothetical protein
VRFTLPWMRRRRTRVQQRLAALAEQIQENERRAARQRLLEAARRRNTGPAWNAATLPLPITNRPLLTPGQAHRTRHMNGR